MAYAASASGGRAARCSRVVALLLLLLCVALTLPVSQAFTLPGTLLVVRRREGGREGRIVEEEEEGNET